MSNLSFIPQATASKPALEFQHPTLSEKRTEFGVNSFDKFLKSANENQAKIKPFPEKAEQNRPVERKAKPEPKQDEVKTAEQSRLDKVESQSKPDQVAANDGKAKEASQGQNSEKEKSASEVHQEQPVEEVVANGGQGDLMAILAHLAEAEAVIRGETQPETVQMVELAEAIQVTDVSETNGVNMAAASMTQADAEGRMLNGAESELVAANPGLKVDDLSPKTEGTAEKSIEAKTAGLEQFSQIMSQVSGSQSRAEGESLSNQGRNDGKGHISESVKVSQDSNIETEGQAFDKAIFTATTLSEKTEDGVLVGENPGLVQHDQTEAKSGKVNLTLIQTQLAVEDEVKTEMPVLNVTSLQPSISNASQAQTTGSAEVNSTNREELFSQIVEHAKVVVNNSGSEMEVNLRPEHLGKLQLKVTIENEVVTAKFVAESQQVKEIIENNLGQLKRNLQENGMQVDAIMVSVGNQQGNEGFDQTAYNKEGFNDFQGTTSADNGDALFEAEGPAPVAERDTVVDLIA